MKFEGFSASGLDLLIENRLHNSKDFYEAHKEEIKQTVIEPFYRLCEAMTPSMLKIDPAFVTVPSRMICRVRRDTRFTKDKTLYRDHIWFFFRRARGPFESVPFFYFEIAPDYWAYGCAGAFEPAEMQQVREMILREDKFFLDAWDAVHKLKKAERFGDFYKRPKYPDAKPEYQDWLNRKSFGVGINEYDNFAPLFDGSFVKPMLRDLERLAPLYRMFLAAKERSEVGAGR